MKKGKLYLLGVMILMLALVLGSSLQAQETAEATKALYPFCHIELPTTDFQKSKAFYEALFNWSVYIDTTMEYAGFETGEGIVGGFLKVDQICAEKGCTTAYVLVESVDDMCKKAESLGAVVCMPKTAVAEMGWFAVIVDPCGAAIGLWESAKKE
ncbi:MAG: VOC family protein [bacterium]